MLCNRCRRDFPTPASFAAGAICQQCFAAMSPPEQQAALAAAGGPYGAPPPAGPYGAPPPSAPYGAPPPFAPYGAPPPFAPYGAPIPGGLARRAPGAVGAFITTAVSFAFGCIVLLHACGTTKLTRKSTMPTLAGLLTLGAMVGLVWAIVALARSAPPGQRWRKGLAVAALCLSIWNLFGGGFWLVFGTASCPHVYSFDGVAYRLDADPLSGALFQGAEAQDLARLEHLRPVAGEYRLRIANELDEVDHVDRVALLVADHPEGQQVLPAADGALWRVTAPAPPRRAVDGRGRDLTALVAHADGRAFVSRAGDFGADERAPREHLTLTFPRPAGAAALLVLRARTTRFAADAFYRYLARMGTSLRVLLEAAQDDRSYRYRDRLRDEMQRLGLLLTVEAWDGGAWVVAATLPPIGPAVPRSLAVPLRLPPGSGEVTLRLGMTPLFWEVDEARLAPAPAAPERPLVVRPVAATGPAGDVLPALAAADGQRLRLAPGQTAEVRFAAPPPPAAARTVVLAIRGFYEPDLPSTVLLNPVAILRHRSGADSLPRYALELARARARP